MNTNKKTLNVDTKAILGEYSTLTIRTPKSCSECEYSLNVGHRNMCVLNKKIENIYHTRKRHPQCPLQPIVSNEEVETKRLVELNVEIVNALLGYECDLNELIPRIDNHFEALQQPKISDSEVEELIEECRNYLPNLEYENLVLKFQQMQQEIEELRAEADITFQTLINQKEGTVTVSEERFNELDKNDLKLYKYKQMQQEIERLKDDVATEASEGLALSIECGLLEKQNNQYKQLLDEISGIIGLKASTPFPMTKEEMEVYNILKQLKTLGKE